MLNELKIEASKTYTENGGVSYSTTADRVFDLFSLGGAYRERSKEDTIALFASAYRENPTFALKCLFYLRDARGGQGERAFFRVCLKWLANYDPDAVLRNLGYIPEFGRWDDLFELFDTPVEAEVMQFIAEQLAMDIKNALKEDSISLLAKWLPSENTSSQETRRKAKKIREYLHMTPKLYRKTLSELRNYSNVLERLMSDKRWDEIDFSAVPSKAGLKYSKAFLKNKETSERYQEFIQSKNTKVHAGTLYPADVVHKVMGKSYYDMHYTDLEDRAIYNKYWGNLTDYFKGAKFNGIAVVDTSGSMYGRPIEVAISLGLYCAGKCNPGSPFYNHYISFSSRPELVEITGQDFCSQVINIYDNMLCDNTNIEAVFNLLLNTALKHQLPQSELPENIIIISDMEFDSMTNYRSLEGLYSGMETIRNKWEEYGYKMPNLVYWNVNARHNLIPEAPKNGVSFVSGYSPVILDSILTGKTGKELMFETLKKYDMIR